ncbi:hypothetical protein B7494_g7432 [Chlorociboria aeruginascens]|nr:hypothetical protein B7494_g7432 [Chlorociboria aeruginascens]
MRNMPSPRQNLIAPDATLFYAISGINANRIEDGKECRLTPTPETGERQERDGNCLVVGVLSTSNFAGTTARNLHYQVKCMSSFDDRYILDAEFECSCIPSKISREREKMSDQTPFTWKETSPGRYEREVDELELLYTSLAKLYEGTGRTFFAISGYVELTLSFAAQDPVSSTEQRLETAFRKAWRSLRYEHPTLGSYVEHNESIKKCKKIYETFIENEPGKNETAWLEATFRKIDNGKSGLEFCNDDPPVNKYPTLYFIVPPPNDEDVAENILRRHIVFRSHHDIIDGIGTLILLNNLFIHASKAYALQVDYPKVAFGDEFKNLSPSFRIAAGVPEKSTREHNARMQQITAKNTADKEHAEVIGIPFKLRTEIPARSQRVAITLTESETASVLKKCKDILVSVTQAFHSSVALAVRDLQQREDHERTGRYINYCLINLRSHCTPPYNSSRHPASVYHSASGKRLVIDIIIPSKSSTLCPDNLKSEFSIIVQQVREFYLSVQSDPDHVSMVPLYFNDSTPQYPEQGCDVPPPNMLPSVSISSMGVIDKIIKPQHRDFQLSNPWVTGEELSTGVGIFLGTWIGELTLSAVYNEAYHEKEDIIGFLENVKRVVFLGLGVYD